MKHRIAAIADNLHNLQYRVEEFRGVLDKEADYETVEHLEPLRTAVNNLAAVLIVAEDSLQEIKEIYEKMSEVQSPISNRETVN